MNKYAATLLLSFLPHLVWGQSFSIPYSKNKTLEYTGKELPTYLSLDVRIDTIGKYTFPGARSLTVYIYKDPDGMLAETRKINGNTVNWELDPAKEVALITVQTD